MARIQVSDLSEKLTLEPVDFIHIKDGTDGIDYKFTFSNFLLPSTNPTRQTVENLGAVAFLDIVPIGNGGTGADTASGARTNLGLTNLSTTTGSTLGLALVTASTQAEARGDLGLGSLATLNSINNSNWSGTDLSILNGGTGASTAATARTNLGLGSAATRNVGTGTGNVPEYTSGGLSGYGYGGTLDSVPDPAAEDALNVTRFYRVINSASTNFSQGGAALHFNYNNDLAAQLFIPVGSDAMQWRKKIAGVWESPRTLWDDVTLPSPVQFDDIGQAAETNSYLDLDDLPSLGTAAARNVGTDNGNLMEVGAGGLLATSSSIGGGWSQDSTSTSFIASNNDAPTVDTHYGFKVQASATTGVAIAGRDDLYWAGIYGGSPSWRRVWDNNTLPNPVQFGETTDGFITLNYNSNTLSNPTLRLENGGGTAKFITLYSTTGTYYGSVQRAPDNGVLIDSTVNTHLTIEGVLKAELDSSRFRVFDDLQVDGVISGGGLGSAAFRSVGTGDEDIPEYTTQGLSGYGYGGLAARVDSEAEEASLSIIQFYTASSSANTVFSQAGVGLNLPFSSDLAAQVYFPVGTNAAQWRQRVNSTTWGDPRTFWDDDNLANPATTDTNQTISGQKTFTSPPRPATNGGTSLGLTSLRWATVWAQDGDFSGTVEAPNVIATSTLRSDPKLKTKRVKADITREQLDSLTLWYFEWRQDRKGVPDYLKGKHDIGVMADAVKKVFPECVHEHKGVLTVDYAKLGVCLTLADMKLRREGK